MGFQNNLFLYVRPLESSSVYVVINWHWEDLTISSFNKWFSLHDIVHCHLFKKDQQFLKNKILWEIYINRWSRSTPLVGLSSEFLGFFVEQSLYAEMHKPFPADPEPFPSLPEPFVSLPRDCCLSTGICSTEHTETVQKTCSLWAWTSLSVCYFQPALPFLSERKAWMGSPANSAGRLCTNGFLSELWLQERDTNT